MALQTYGTNLLLTVYVLLSLSNMPKNIPIINRLFEKLFPNSVERLYFCFVKHTCIPGCFLCLFLIFITRWLGIGAFTESIIQR